MSLNGSQTCSRIDVNKYFFVRPPASITAGSTFFRIGGCAEARILISRSYEDADSFTNTVPGELLLNRK